MAWHGMVRTGKTLHRAGSKEYRNDTELLVTNLSSRESRFVFISK
jgi:hypothetical protein